MVTATLNTRDFVIALEDNKLFVKTNPNASVHIADVDGKKTITIGEDVNVVSQSSQSDSSEYDPAYRVDTHLTSLESPLTSEYQERTLTLTGVGGDPDHYYKFTFSPDTAGYVTMHQLLGTTSSGVKDVTLTEAGEIVGLILGGDRQEQITLKVKAIASVTYEEFDYNATAWSYHSNKQGQTTNEHSASVINELVITNK